jgi:hypothetical protein
LDQEFDMFRRIAFAAAALMIPSWLAAQTPAFPRTPEGKPDFSGIWQTGGISLTGGPQGNIVGAGGGARGGAGAAPRGGAPRGGAPRGGAAPQGRGAGAAGGAAGLPTQPPMKPDALAKSNAMTNKDDPTVHCLPPGVPRVIGMPMPFEIVQTPKQVVILYEAFSTFRVIPTDGREPIPLAPSFNGESAGRWDGDTLVVEVKNFNGKIWGPGNMKDTSDKYRVVERYTPNGNNIAYEAIIEDPEVLTGPFVYRATLQRPPETRVAEYICVENNIDVEHLVGR